MSVKSMIMNVKAAISKRLLPLRIIAAVIAFAIIAMLLLGANDLLGNPVSYSIVKSNAEKYVAENYADEGYVLEDIGYSFKFKIYYAYIAKPGSEDCRFTADFSPLGKFGWDDHESRVLNGGNVRSRLCTRYRELADSVLESPAYPYSSHVAFGDLIFEDDDYNGGYDFGLPPSCLVPDALYDIAELGEKAGLLTIYVETEEITPEHAAEVLLEINSLMEQGGVPFYAIDLTLETPRKAYQKNYADREYYSLLNFHRSDIYEDGLVERVKDNRQKTEEYWAELDKKYK